MNLVIEKKPKHIGNPHLTNECYLDSRVGFWGDVISSDAITNTCRVLADTGMIYSGIRVASQEWVCNKTENLIVTGERYLPPKDARVFVLTPTGTIAGAFILCSGFTIGDTDTHTFFSNKANNDTDKNIRERVTQSGWKIKEYYKSGRLELKNKNGTAKIEISSEGEINLNDGALTIAAIENTTPGA